MSATNQAPSAGRQHRRARIAALRKRLLALALAVFVAAWIALFIQLTSGHDPALAKQSASSAQTAGSGTSGSSATASSGGSSSGSTGVSPVRTRQS